MSWVRETPGALGDCKRSLVYVSRFRHPALMTQRANHDTIKRDRARSHWVVGGQGVAGSYSLTQCAWSTFPMVRELLGVFLAYTRAVRLNASCVWDLSCAPEASIRSLRFTERYQRFQNWISTWPHFERRTQKIISCKSALTEPVESTTFTLLRRFDPSRYIWPHPEVSVWRGGRAYRCFFSPNCLSWYAFNHGSPLRPPLRTQSASSFKSIQVIQSKSRALTPTEIEGHQTQTESKMLKVERS